MPRKKQEEAEEMTLEQGFEKLDGLLEIMENRDTSLEDAFTAYREGMDLLKVCAEKLDMVEKKMQMMNEEGELS